MVLDLFRLDGKVAVVTGASQGLGRGMAVALAQAGAAVVLVARNEAALTALAAELREAGHTAVPLPCDLSRAGAPASVVERVVAAHGRLDILVTAAAMQVRKPALEVTEDEWDSLIRLNLRSVYFLCQAAARAMIPQGGGKIINIASLTSTIAWPDVSIYATGKGGIAQMTKALAFEWARYGIRVNAIGPGTFHTNLTDAVYRDPKKAQEIVARVPLGRAGVPEDLAGAVVFLASPASDYVTGQVLYVDGGRLLH
ncbi:MAG TPA: glucose 1-dehydrogenase [Limnochordia bacterium]